MVLNHKNMADLTEKLKKIKAFVFDVDGVLTDGSMIATPDGDLLRSFDAKDGMAFRLAHLQGYHLGVITGGRCKSIWLRFQHTGVSKEDCYLKSRNKLADFHDFLKRHDLKAEEVMFFGDDLPDIPVMLECGCSVCPSDAVKEVLDIADYISPKPGGKGVARDAFELVLRLHGNWELDIEDYAAKF